MTRNDDDPFEWIIDHRGRPAKIVKAGVTYRVPMMARDSLSPVQQAVIADRMRITDASGGTAGLHRPGPRFASDAGFYDAAAKAYAQRVADSESAWIDGPGGGQQDSSSLGTEYSGKPGDACTVRAGATRGWMEGSPGHLAYVDVEGKDVLMCVPDGPSDRRTGSAPILDWRTTDLAKLVRDAEAIKEEAYETACSERERAWMRLGSQ